MPLILVDTSSWIEILNVSRKPLISMDQIEQMATCPPVIQEVLQGVGSDIFYQKIKDILMAMPCFGDPLHLRYFDEAAQIYRHGRKKGYTIRSSNDCLIAAIALEHNLPILHNDRDYSQIEKFTRLKIVEKI